MHELHIVAASPLIYNGRLDPSFLQLVPSCPQHMPWGLVDRDARSRKWQMQIFREPGRLIGGGLYGTEDGPFGLAQGLARALARQPLALLADRDDALSIRELLRKAPISLRLHDLSREVVTSGNLVPVGARR